MIEDYKAFIEHLKKTGRMKLLPQVLRELKAEHIREAKRSPRRETVKDNPALLSGWRELRNGVLEDHTGKRALIEIYQKITG